MLVENGYRVSENWSGMQLTHTPNAVRYVLLLRHVREMCGVIFLKKGLKK